MKYAKLLPFILTLATANAATLTVTTNADSGAGSLRAQIAAAAGGDTIDFAISGTISLATGEIAITSKNLSITGPGANNLTITTNATTRALRIVNAQCAIRGITFNNCRGLPGDVDTGGAIAVDNFTAGGRLNVTAISDCNFTNNQSGWGGAVDIFNGGLVMDRCSFAGNSCTGVAFGTNGGGGALSIGATVASTITNCTFSGNSQNGTATGQPGGGAIYNYGSVPADPPPVTVEHCTFAGNVDAAAAAGAIRGNYTSSYHTWANLRNCLLVNNQAPAAVLRNFAGNPVGSLAASYASLGGNVTDETTTSAQFMAAGGDKVSSGVLAATVSPVLALNGGVTPTHAISRGSPAQRTGLASTTSVDQRGAPRHASADAGAFELIEPEISITVSAVPVAENGSLTFGSTPFDTPVSATVTITNTQTSSFTTGPLMLGNVSSPAGFSIAGFPSAPLANGQSATFDITLTAASTGLFNSPLNFTGNDAFNPALATTSAGSPNLHLINLAGLVTDTLEHWRQQHFGAGATNVGIAADNANPSGDGITNLLKYALGLNPHLAYRPGIGITNTLDPQGCLRMTVAKNPAATDLTLTIQGSGDLGNPSGWSADGIVVDQNTETILEAHDSVSIGSAQKRFIRLNVAR